MAKVQKRKRITVTEAAKYLGIQKSKFYRMLKKGEFPANHTNARGWYITKRALNEYLAEQKPKVVQDQPKAPSLKEQVMNYGLFVVSKKEVGTENLHYIKVVDQESYTDTLCYKRNDLSYSWAESLQEAAIFNSDEMDFFFDEDGLKDLPGYDFFDFLENFVDSISKSNKDIEISVSRLEPTKSVTWIYEPSVINESKNKTLSDLEKMVLKELTLEQLEAIITKIKGGKV